MSWKTSLFGLMAAIGGGLLAAMVTGVIDPADFPKWFKSVAGLLSVVGTSGIGFFARDNNKSSEDVGLPAKDPQGRLWVLAGLLLMIGAVLTGVLLTGCASFNSVQVQTKADGTRIESHQRIYTFWDSQNSVAKLRASTTDKTQGLTVGSISEASESSNAVSLVESSVGAAVRAAIGAAK